MSCSPLPSSTDWQRSVRRPLCIAAGSWWSWARRTKAFRVLVTSVSELRTGPGGVILLSLALTALADAYRRVGRQEIALTHLAEAERVAGAGLRRPMVLPRLVRAEVLARTGNLVGAEANLKSAIAAWQHSGAKLFELRAAVSSSPPLARPGQAQGSLRPPRANLRLVHRGLPLPRSARGQGAAR